MLVVSSIYTVDDIPYWGDVGVKVDPMPEIWAYVAPILCQNRLRYISPMLPYEPNKIKSRIAYDKRVVGVIAGAGGYKPGIILDRKETSARRMPIALLGKVYCKVDAEYAAIEVTRFTNRRSPVQILENR